MLVYKCDRCEKEITDKKDVYNIDFRISVKPRMPELDDIIQENLNGLDFCKECAIEMVKLLHKPLEKPEDLGI